MAAAKRCAFRWALAAAVVGAIGPRSSRAEGVPLREATTVGAATRVVVELKAEGVSRPAAPPNQGGAKEIRPLALRVETRFAFDERVLKVDRRGEAKKVA